ncbi:CBS domain-containing protein [Deinococcus marmoris]|uniref:CBS domain-containing protein n=1 Tax=Deinococcus marmoris TaxID=249408 RepID=UPI00158A5166|nr:CBS domain-containing protein [Deinococcus marmoris]
MGGYKDIYLQLFGFDVKIQAKIEKLFTQIKDARNDKAHRGPFARSVVKRASEFALFVEGELAEMLYNAEDFMSSSVVFAREKDYLYKIRGIILENSYSYIPIQIKEDYYFVSDFEISKIWTKLSKTDKYSKKLSDLIKADQLKLLQAEFVNTKDDLKKVIEKMEKSQFIPILVKDKDGDVVGIITAFDLL